jgi:hypothetical protein
MMKCFFCDYPVKTTNPKETKAVLCGSCVAKISDPPEIKEVAPKLSIEEKAERKAIRAEKKKEKLEKLKTAKRGMGRGWHLKKLFEFEGTYFSMGKEITPAEASKLRRTLKKEGK